MNMPTSASGSRKLKYPMGSTSAERIRVLFLAMSGGTALLGAFYYFSKGPQADRLALVFFLVGLLALGLARFHHNNLKKRETTVFELFPDRLLINNGKKIHAHLFRDVTRVATSRQRFTLISSLSNRASIDVWVSDADYILDVFYRARPDLLSRERYDLMREHLILGNFVNLHTRYMTSSGFILKWMFFCLSLGGAALYLQSRQLGLGWNKELFRYTLFDVLVLWMLAFCGYFVVWSNAIRVVIRQGLAKTPAVTRVSSEFEAKLSAKLQPIAVTVFLVVVATYFVIGYNLQRRYRMDTDVAKFGLVKGDSVTFDLRYNCVDCAYAVGVGDLVAVELPSGEKVLAEVLQTKLDVREPASTTQTSARYVRVHTLEGAEQDLDLSEQKLIGRLIR